MFFEECNKGKPYNITMKLSGCNDDEFTCDDGQCIDIKNRCDQIIDCRDKTDELDCRLLVLQDGYNQAISPFTMVSKCQIVSNTISFSLIQDVKSRKIKPTEVNISTSLTTVIEISERSHIMELKFEINIEWYEYRAKYFNIKENTALNVLSVSEMRMLWMPYIIFQVPIYEI